MEPYKKAFCGEPTYIPEDFLHQMILPQLSCKELSHFKAVSKTHQAMISDTQFSSLQAISPSPASTGFVFMEEHSGLSFLSDLDTVGVPDPSLKFMVKSPRDARLLSSTNGLLLFSLFGVEQPDICVCNPATMKKEILPKAGMESRHKYMGRKHMGLAFNPHTTPQKFVVVDALQEAVFGGMRYTFNVFQSQTGAWKLSKQEVYIPGSRNAPSNPVYAQGLLYWHCIDFLLWFDPENPCSGTILFPYYENTESVRKFIEVFKDQICCMCVNSEGGIEVWVLTGQAQWERMYGLSMKKLIHESPDNLYFGLSDAEAVLTSYPIWTFVTPLAFDGRNVYVAVGSKDWQRVKYSALSQNRIGFDEYSALFLPDVDPYNQISFLMMSEEEQSYYFCDTETDDDCEANFEEDLFCCDMVTGKVVNTGKRMTRTERNCRIFHYHNSKVMLPPVLK